MRYKRSLFDADDTLFDFQAGNRRAVGLLMEELGLASPTVYDEYQRINHACWEALDRGEMTQDVLYVERFRRFLAEKGRSDDPQVVADRFGELLGMQAILLENALRVTEEISAKLPVVILTNGITVIQKRRMALSPLKDLISDLVISQEVGISKPDPRIYLHALKGVDPKDALMVGDSLKSDILGANRAGIDACWYNPGKKPLSGDVHAEYVIHDLLQLPAIALQE